MHNMGRRKRYDDMVLLFSWALSWESERRRSPHRTSGHSIRHAKLILAEAASQKVLDSKYGEVHRVTINRAVGDRCSSIPVSNNVRGSAVFDRSGRMIFPGEGITNPEHMDPVEVLRLSMDAEKRDSARLPKSFQR